MRFSEQTWQMQPLQCMLRDNHLISHLTGLNKSKPNILIKRFFSIRYCHFPTTLSTEFLMTSLLYLSPHLNLFRDSPLFFILSGFFIILSSFYSVISKSFLQTSSPSFSSEVYIHCSSDSSVCFNLPSSVAFGWLYILAICMVSSASSTPVAHPTKCHFPNALLVPPGKVTLLLDGFGIPKLFWPHWSLLNLHKFRADSDLFNKLDYSIVVTIAPVVILVLNGISHNTSSCLLTAHSKLFWVCFGWLLVF